MKLKLLSILMAILAFNACENIEAPTANNMVHLPANTHYENSQFYTKDFDGKIKRIRIKDRRSGQTYRMSADYKGRIRRIRLRERDSGTDYRVTADFKGRIRRIRIKERANGANYNFTINTELDNSSEVELVVVKIEGENGKQSFKLTPTSAEFVGQFTFDGLHNLDGSLIQGKTTMEIQALNKDGKVLSPGQGFDLLLEEPIKEVKEEFTPSKSI